MIGRNSLNWIKGMFTEFKSIKSTKKELREFGLTIGTILVILGGVALWRGKDVYPYFIAPGIAFIVIGLITPVILKPLQKIWMGLSIVIGYFMSRLILALLFYFVITPIGSGLKLLGKDILDEHMDKTRSTYWTKRPAEVKDKKSYENQY